jgi:hypothetical protein
MWPMGIRSLTLGGRRTEGFIEPGPSAHDRIVAGPTKPGGAGGRRSKRLRGAFTLLQKQGPSFVYSVRV